MNVRLHKTGEYDAASRINRLISTRASLFANFRDASITNKQITANDGIRFVHRHNLAVLDENRFAHVRRLPRGLCGDNAECVKRLLLLRSTTKIKTQRALRFSQRTQGTPLRTFADDLASFAFRIPLGWFRPRRFP